MTFENLFQRMISKSVLTHYWKKIKNDFHLLSITEESADFLFNLIRVSHPRIKDNKILEVIGASAIIEKAGVRGLRQLLKDPSGQHWRKIKKLIDTTDCYNTSKLRLIKGFEDALASFETLRLNDLKKK